MQASIHLVFGGQCEEAFQFYERVLGGKIVNILAYGNSPIAEQVPPGWRDKIVHGNFAVGGTVLAGADMLPEQYVKPQGFYVLLSVDDAMDAERIFSALAENGEIHMAIQQTFWSSRFGVLTDQFGIPWEISCEKAPSVA
ncbi:MAG TPA: VOC family protein [Steroidobacteraceae bacterium]|jgi:PhnB protein